MTALGLVSRASPVQTAGRNCTRDEGGPFGFGDQELIPSHRKLLWSKAMVVSVATTRERTEEQYRTLFEAAGFTLSRVVATRSELSIIEGRPA